MIEIGSLQPEESPVRRVLNIVGSLLVTQGGVIISEQMCTHPGLLENRVTLK